MKKSYPVEFVYQIVSLIVAAILVHGIYVLMVRPKADVILAEQAARIMVESDYVPERSVWVIIRDFEQEACFILMLWAMAIMAYKTVSTGRERRLLEEIQTRGSKHRHYRFCTIASNLYNYRK